MERGRLPSAGGDPRRPVAFPSGQPSVPCELDEQIPYQHFRGEPAKKCGRRLSGKDCESETNRGSGRKAHLYRQRQLISRPARFWQGALKCRITPFPCCGILPSYSGISNEARKERL